MRLKIITLFILLLIVITCGEKKTGPSNSVADLVTEGWTLFSEATGEADFESAKVKFQEAIQQDTTYADAHNGMGWCFAKLDSLNESIQAFQTCIDIDPPDSIKSEAYAGISITYNAAGDFQSSIDNGSYITAGWVFSRDTNVNYQDIILILAEDYYLIGEFTLSLYKVQILDPGFNANVNTPQGRSQLAQKVELLKSTIMG